MTKGAPDFTYIKCPLNKYTFSIKPIREWVVGQCQGRVLNLFAGATCLPVDETRNDIDPEAAAEYHMDARDFCAKWNGPKFDTILLDPPYSYRKSMEFYKGFRASPFRQLKDEIVRVVNPGARVITFGYHSVCMGINRGFAVEHIALLNHGGAMHDTIATIEKSNL